MRRPVMYLAGLLLATGASLALAGPASAAVSHDSKCHHHSHHHGLWANDWDDEDGFDSYFYSNTEDSYNRYYGVNILTGGLL